MMRAYRHLGALLAAAVLAGVAGPADAGSREGTYDACKEAIKKEFGASPVEFGKFNRINNRNNAFGELTMSDGTKARIRCRVYGGKVLKVQFRGGGRPGQAWINERPAAAIYVEPKDEDEAEKKAAVEKAAVDKSETDATKGEAGEGKDGDKAADGKDGDGKDGDGKDGDGKAATEKKADGADKDTAAKDGADKDGADKKAGDGDETAKADADKTRSRFKKAPKR